MSNNTTLIDLLVLSQSAELAGPQWGHASEDLNLTLLHWRFDEGVPSHVNAEVDVVLLVIAGSGEVTVNGVVHALTPGQAIVIPKGTERAIRATAEQFDYLSLHRRRHGLWPSVTIPSTNDE